MIEITISIISLLLIIITGSFILAKKAEKDKGDLIDYDKLTKKYKDMDNDNFTVYYDKNGVERIKTNGEYKRNNRILDRLRGILQGFGSKKSDKGNSKDSD
jgi:hypothetical protein